MGVTHSNGGGCGVPPPKRARRLSGGGDSELIAFAHTAAASHVHDRSAALALVPTEPARVDTTLASPRRARRRASAASVGRVATSSADSPGSSPGRKKDAFVVVGEDGTPLSRDDGEGGYVYDAAKPSFAAVKAYYALLRKRAVDSRVDAALITAAPLADLPDTDRRALEEVVRSHASDAAAADAYMRKVAAATAEPPAVIRLRRPNETRVYTYRVQYERVRRPNRHEVAKGIVKVAHASKI